jgi:hypothetical protein
MMQRYTLTLLQGNRNDTIFSEAVLLPELFPPQRPRLFRSSDICGSPDMPRFSRTLFERLLSVLAGIFRLFRNLVE